MKKTGSDVIRARGELRVVADELDEHGLCTLANRVRYICDEYLRRRSETRNAGVKARFVTPELRAQLRAYAVAHPDIVYRDIGRRFNVDGGRVSEAVTGGWKKKLEK